LNRVSSLHKQITSLQEILTSDESAEGQVNVSYKPVLEQAKALDKKLTELESPIYNHDIQPGTQDSIHYLQRFHDRLQGAFRGVISTYGQAPNELLVEETASLKQELEKHLQAFNAVLNTDVPNFNKLAAEHGSSTLFAGGPIQIKSEGGVSSGAGSGDEDEE
jgi:hypothetical protein